MSANPAPSHERFPSTRFQGSKLKLLPWLAEQLAALEFDTFLDAFGGTGCVGYLAKTLGKCVTVNDALRCNAATARALVENASARLVEDAAPRLFRRDPARTYGRFIESQFGGIFYLDHENRWLDVAAQNIQSIPDRYERALALHALFQACLAKRPYNLFHRANLYMRTADVERSFGNKATWDKPFAVHFLTALREANNAVFDNGRTNRALVGDALEVPGDFDLVYIDPPYMSHRGVSVDYLDFYHFIEGLTEYEAWPAKIEPRYKHKPYRRQGSPWLDKCRIDQAFAAVFDRFRDSILVVSYRDNGLPPPQEIAASLGRFKPKVRTIALADYRYVLSTRRSRELLFIGE